MLLQATCLVHEKKAYSKANNVTRIYTHNESKIITIILVFILYDSRHTCDAPNAGHAFLYTILYAYLFVMSIHL